MRATARCRPRGRRARRLRREPRTKKACSVEQASVGFLRPRRSAPPETGLPGEGRGNREDEPVVVRAGVADSFVIVDGTLKHPRAKVDKGDLLIDGAAAWISNGNAAPAMPSSSPSVLTMSSAAVDARSIFSGIADRAASGSDSETACLTSCRMLPTAVSTTRSTRLKSESSINGSGLC